MLPYFIFTEDVQIFCELMGYSVEHGATHAKYVCMYSLQYSSRPHIAMYGLDSESQPFIPNEKVLDYLALILNGYSFRDAVKEIGCCGGLLFSVT